MGRLCRLCDQRPVSPSRLRAWDYRCNYCRRHTPSHVASNARYAKSDKRKAVMKRDNQKRIMVGAVYHSRAASAADARVVNAHIKERRLGFVKGQQDREKAESATPGGVPPEAAV